MELLNLEMTRYHNNMRSRDYNPTYRSSHMAASLGMFTLEPKNTHRRSMSTLELKNSSAVSTPQAHQPNLRRSSSQLIQYGHNSLPIGRFNSDKEIYDKQAKRYNIINTQPREYNDTIKVFPKYHLENSDVNFSKKKKLEAELQEKLMSYSKVIPSSLPKIDTSHKYYARNNPELAPKPARKEPLRGKALNNADDVGQIMK